MPIGETLRGKGAGNAIYDAANGESAAPAEPVPIRRQISAKYSRDSFGLACAQMVARCGIVGTRPVDRYARLLAVQPAQRG